MEEIQDVLDTVNRSDTVNLIGQYWLIPTFYFPLLFLFSYFDDDFV